MLGTSAGLIIHFKIFKYNKVSNVAYYAGVLITFQLVVKVLCKVTVTFRMSNTGQLQ